MIWTLSEAAVDAVRDYLVLNLETILGVIDTEKDDGITLPVPVAFVVGAQELDRISEYPIGYVFATNMLGDMLPAGGQGLRATHTIQVGIIAEDDDTQRLRRRIYRYGRALIEAVADAQRTGNLTPFALVGTPQVTYSPTLSDGSFFLGDVLLEWELRGTEVR